ncbi:MAG: hypothetical protein LQ339_003037 [Xanthoria mediterranea]|nr:MAG: hypothetical protein LQ339_003037 [Xanthoria mediterranea]
MKTRVSRSAKPVQADCVKATNRPTLQQDPVKLVLLPQSAGPDARMCTLAHPSTSKASRYYWCPRGGLHEFQKVRAPRRAYRSWLLGPTAACTPTGLGLHSASQPAAEQVNRKAQSCAIPGVEALSKAPKAAPFGHTVKDADISIATSIDVLFFALPSLHTQASNNAKGLFLSVDDLFDTALESPMQLKYLLLQDALRQAVEKRIAAVCDDVDAGNEKRYRLNMDKLVLEIVAKARRMSSSGLPRSMEANFVDKALEAPIINLEREASSISTAATETIPGTNLPSASIGEKQLTLATCESNGSDCSFHTNRTVPDHSPQLNVQDHFKDLLRLRTALSFIMSSYLSKALATAIQTILDSPSSPVDFKPLDEYLAYLGRLREEALASCSISNISRKRNMVDDEEDAEAKAEKRRKKEEDEKRQKAGLTRGIRELKKVDVTGMKKMSDFFGRKLA